MLHSSSLGPVRGATLLSAAVTSSKSSRCMDFAHICTLTTHGSIDIDCVARQRTHIQSCRNAFRQASIMWQTGCVQIRFNLTSRRRLRFSGLSQVIVSISYPRPHYESTPITLRRVLVRGLEILFNADVPMKSHVMRMCQNCQPAFSNCGSCDPSVVQ